MTDYEREVAMENALEAAEYAISAVLGDIDKVGNLVRIERDRQLDFCTLRLNENLFSSD